MNWNYPLSVPGCVNCHPRVVQHGPHALSLCSSHHSALDFINTLFDLASSQCKPKYSTELAVSPSAGSGLNDVCVFMCVCVYVCVSLWAHSGGSGSTSFSWTRKLWITLALPGRTQREQSWAGWTQAGCLSRSLASHWHQAGGESSTYLTLTRQATPSLCSPGWHAAGIFLYGEVFSALASAVACTDNLSLWNFEKQEFIDWM